ncbi:MAG: hypothetical protein M3N21_00190 [Actinomycetota bacterium]|nr:hypothetical protein [Actinomycetota bacterium]
MRVTGRPTGPLRRALLVATSLGLVAAAAGFAAAAPPAGPRPWTGLRAGVGVVDDTWHVGAGAGQYASNPNPQDVSFEWDPNLQHVKQASSYGVASRLSIRALVLRDGQGHPPVALVKTDNYLSQDMLSRRAAQILAADGSAVTYDHLMISATHDHNSPYYATPEAGVWAFQDVMDLRMFEDQARRIARAVETAERSLRPARVGATTVAFSGMQGNIAGADVNEDGSPTGYPLQDNDHGLVVMRVDDVSGPVPAPLATWVNYAQHGESLDGYDLISADWLAPFQRYVDRATGAPVVFSQGSVGSAEGPYEHAYPAGQAPTTNDQGQPVATVFGHMGYAQAERGAHLLADRVVAAWRAIGGAPGPAVQVPWQTDVPVTMLTHLIAGPVSHPYPSVGNCRTGPSQGDPGLPAAGLPNCERVSSAGGPVLPAPDAITALKAAGLPVPDNYDASSFASVEENLRLKLQAVRIGAILLASCACEPQSDLIKAIETRTDRSVGNMWNGFDYTDPAAVAEGWPVGFDHGLPARPVRPCYQVGASFSCPDPRDPVGVRRLTVGGSAVAHMHAQVTNDAAGWDAPSYAAQANSEPTDLTKIKGNFTHQELGAGSYAHCPGFQLSVGLGHTSDYNGYTVSYREYQSRDAYRKALTSYGPHTADYMSTRLVAMAANLMCGTPVPAEPTDPLAAADEARQSVEALVLGRLSSYYLDTWSAQIPDSAGTPAGVLQPAEQVQRFDAATFSWVGGDNWTDNPTVHVQRLVNGRWTDYADQSGEVQVVLDQPPAATAVNARVGGQRWTWTASFEAFDAWPRADVAGGQTPDGTYRFTVEGVSHRAGSGAPYRVESRPFTIVDWQGIAVSDLRKAGTSVTFVIAPVVYPRLPANRSRVRWYADDQGATPGHSIVCKTCTFRPWARTGTVSTARVVVFGAGGGVTTVAAHRDARTGRWTATVPAGSRVAVRPGDVRDAFGETNGTGLGPV